MIVTWSALALVHLDEILDYWLQFNPGAAVDLVSRIKEAGDGLAISPRRGRVVGRYHELVTIRPYVIRYRIEGGKVMIARVRHSARRPLK